MVFTLLVLGLANGALLFGQQAATTAPGSPAIREFPVLLQQNVVAGKTSAGSRVTAKLEVATLVNGTVIPRNATFSGEVLESAAKTKTDPSRLTIRMDTVQWKNGSAAMQVYLTPWYYPTTDESGQNLQYGPQEPAKRTWNGQGQYPDPNSKVYRPFPGGDSDKAEGAPDTPSSSTSSHRVLMKNVESMHHEDGAIEIVSKSSNLKLDKLTTYVLAAGDLLAPK
ncbi:MAG TPA: hypothetical protein VIW68_09245 [Candidatus Sulfotelmatobacter sp.]